MKPVFALIIAIQMKIINMNMLIFVMINAQKNPILPKITYIFVK